MGDVSDPGDPLPVVLFADGEIDLGAGIDTQKYVRRQKTNILEKKMQAGEYVTISFADTDQPSSFEDYTYRITRVTLAQNP